MRTSVGVGSLLSAIVTVFGLAGCTPNFSNLSLQSPQGAAGTNVVGKKAAGTKAPGTKVEVATAHQYGGATYGVPSYQTTLASSTASSSTYTSTWQSTRTSKPATIHPSLGIPILTYHDLSGIPHDKYSVTPQQFAQQMAYLQNNGYHVISLHEVYQELFTTDHVALPSNPIVITLDDGYESNYTVGFPIFKQYDIPATIFMVSSFADKPDFLTWDQLKTMQGSGVVDVESHTVNHPHLADLTAAQVWTEVNDSRQTLQRELGTSVPYFCYPFDSYNTEVIQAVHLAGYQMAVSDNYGIAQVWQTPYALDRIDVSSTLSLPQFALAIKGELPAAGIGKLVGYGVHSGTGGHGGAGTLGRSGAPSGSGTFGGPGAPSPSGSPGVHGSPGSDTGHGSYAGQHSYGGHQGSGGQGLAGNGLTGQTTNSAGHSS